ncbi:MAG: PAS domain S-box protein [Verrucomicrobia bacterium]|nr:PAS domain S-box protein [Cytophagales bacterium]
MNNWQQKTKAQLIAEIQRLQQNQLNALLEADLFPAKLSEKPLQEHQEHFKLIAENAPVLLRIADTEGNFYFFSKQWLNFTGKTLETQQHNGWTQNIHPKDLEQIVSQLQKSFRKRRKFEITYRLHKKNGDYAWVLESGTPFADNEGEFKGFITSVIDITEQRANEEIRQQEQLFQDTEERFHETLRNINLCGITIIKDGTITFCNKFMLATTGYAEEEVIGKNFFDLFVAEEEREVRQQDFARAFENQGLLSSVERTVTAKDGTLRYILFRSYILNNPSGEITGITRIGEDVTQKREVEKKLSYQQSQLQDLFDNASDLIQIFSLKGDIIFTNKSWKNTLGYTEEETAELNLVDIVQPDYLRNTLRKLRKVLKGEDLITFETVFVSKEGKNVFLEGSVTCRFENNQPTAFRCILHDVTDKLRAEKAQQLYYRIGSLIAQSDNLETLYQNIHQELGKVIDARNFYITLLNPENDYLYFPYYVDEEYPADVRITQRRVAKGLIEYGLRNQKPIILYENQIQELIESGEVEIYNGMPKVWIGVPLRIDNRMTGFISLRSYQLRNIYNEKDLEMLDFISGQVALAIERKQNEDRLNKQTAKLNAIFESGKHLMWSVNHRFLLTSFNNNYADFLDIYYGIRPESGNNLERVRLLLTSDKYYWLWNTKYEAAFKGTPQYFEVKTRDKKNQKKFTWWEVYLNPIYLSNESIEEVSAIAHDITQKKSSELALRESESKFRDIFESFQDIYYRSDLAGNISMISPSIYDELGYQPEEVIGNKTSLFVADESYRKNALQRLVKNGTLKNFEVELQAKSGEKIPFLFNIRIINNELLKTVEVEGVARNIAALKKSSSELITAKEDAEKSLKVKESFLANMSHEIRTPMNGIIGMIDLLADTELEPTQQDYVQTVKKSSETLLTILNDILDLSKIDAGKMSLSKAPLSLSETIDKLYALFSQQASTKNNRLTYKIKEEVPKYIIGDETRLLQVLSNFTSNAIKFTENGKILIYVSLLEKWGNQNRIKVEVVDTGIGIAKEKFAMLFNNFSQLDNSSSKSYGGTGLGLAISKALVQLMDGEVGVDSVHGRGSTFWFTFVAESTAVNPATLPGKEEVFRSDEAYFGKYKPLILITDDNPVNQKVASEILRKSGCLVDTASSGEEAIEKVKKQFERKNIPRYDLIFMDIQMPDLDGLETTQILKGMNISDLPPIVAMTAYAMKEDRERFLQAGMDDYLPKPIKAHLLVQKVKEWMMRKGQLSVTKKAVMSNNNLLEADLPKVNKTEQAPTLNKKVIAQLEKYAGAAGVKDILEEFIAEAQEFVLELKTGFQQKDTKKILSILHTLKGNAGTIGAEKLSAIARIMETELKQNPDANIIDNLIRLEENLEEFVKATESLQF